MDARFATYVFMQPDSLQREAAAALAERAAPTPLEILAMLDDGRVAEGMRAAIEALQWVDPAGPLTEENLALGRLVSALAENPIVGLGRARAMGYPGDPDLLDVALGEGRVCGSTPRGRQMLAWMLEHSHFCRALRQRRSYLVAQIEAVGQLRDAGPVVALFPGYARELLASVQYRARRVTAHLVGHDARVAGFARVLHRGLRAEFHQATLAAAIGETLRFYGCSLVYAPDLADHLDEDTLMPLLETALTWLAPGGELVLPAFTESREAGFLEVATDWRPNDWTPSELMRLARGLGDVVTWLRQDQESGLCFLHLQRC
jgi:hypothetical protein